MEGGLDDDVRLQLAQPEGEVIVMSDTEKGAGSLR